MFQDWNFLAQVPQRLGIRSNRDKWRRVKKNGNKVSQEIRRTKKNLSGE